MACFPEQAYGRSRDFVRLSQEGLAMLERFRSRISSAHVIALLALFVAMGGTGYAAVKLPRNSVGASQIKPNGVGSSEVKNGALRKADFKASELPVGVQGPAGPAGAKGDKGANGTNGTNGTNGLQGPAGVVGPVTVQRNDVALADNSTASAEAVCPSGKRAIGGGASVDLTASDDIHMMVSRPGTGALIPADGEEFSNSWRAVYRNPAGGSGAASIRAFVLCANDPTVP